MALVECPDCGRKISDRAPSCPDCMCPVAEVLAEKRESEELAEVLATREMVKDGEVDCPRCQARGWYPAGKKGHLSWCLACEHTGRLLLGSASDGYYGVARFAVERFLSGELIVGKTGVVFHVGKERPAEFERPAGERADINPKHIPWVLEDKS